MSMLEARNAQENGRSVSARLCTKSETGKGFAWEFRYYVMEGSVRKPKVQTFDSAIYKTEKALRQHLKLHR
jgi:hypothetical protein